MITVAAIVNLSQKISFLAQKGSFKAIGARKWPAEQPNGKPKVSRVTSGHGAVMIPLSRVRLRRNKGVRLA